MSKTNRKCTKCSTVLPSGTVKKICKKCDTKKQKMKEDDVNNLMTESGSDDGSLEIIETAKKKKKDLNNTKPICIGTTTGGGHCTSAASEKYDFKFCGRHKFQYENKKAIDKGKRLCQSTRKCASQPPGIKAVLPKDNKSNLCRDCLDAINECERKSRSKISETNSETGKLTCTKCRHAFPRKEMGTTGTGAISSKCKACFARQQEIERNRPKRDRRIAGK